MTNITKDLIDLGNAVKELALHSTEEKTPYAHLIATMARIMSAQDAKIENLESELKELKEKIQQG